MTEQYLQKELEENWPFGEKSTCQCNKNWLLSDDITFIELLPSLNTLQVDQH